MNVAIVVEWLDAWRGGAERSTQQFIQHLVDMGITVEAFTRSPLPPRPGLTVTALLSRRGAGRLNTAAFCSAAEDAIDPRRFDVVHSILPVRCATVYEPRGGTYPETLARNIALRPTAAARSFKRLTLQLNRKAQQMQKRERELLTQPDAPMVIALSDYVVRQLQEHYSFPSERIRKIFNGVNPDTTDAATRAAHRAEVRELYGIGPDELLLLTVAHNFKLKGVRSLIEALAIVEKNSRLIHWRCMVVGKDRTAPWQKLVSTQGLASRVQFPGPTQRIGAFLHAADMLVHPTFYDPCSRVVLEAVASCLPCISTKFDGAAEVLTDGVSGFVLDSPDDAAMLADRIEQLGDRSRRAAMAAAQATILDKVTMRRHAQGVIELYKELVGGAVRA
jgi:UDP-glucose:(heptosyl)LPS alpha-1,3-glucosyltransferase